MVLIYWSMVLRWEREGHRASDFYLSNLLCHQSLLTVPFPGCIVLPWAAVPWFTAMGPGMEWESLIARIIWVPGKALQGS